ncbi:replication initiation protein [Candidatus Arsenophonus triatominarum]|uniref:replication initiation protein n=1 Tax=Candidatus Arsenophonus triatominarum TaxID=57911 RepID=UPI0007C5A407|nr:replication initiation protein [Candidatus Arsenophonus triatominarum]
MSATLDRDPNYNLVQSNDLINASYKLNRNEMRLLVLALSKVDSKTENPGNITLYPKEFINMFSTNEQKVWVTMREALISLSKKQIEFFRLDKNNMRTINFSNWIDGGSFYEKQEDCSKIVLRFTKSIEPYLFELKGNFTICSIESIQNLTNPIAFRLYLIMLSEIKKAKNIELKKSKKLEVHMLKLSILQIRKIFPNISKEFNNIKKFTLMPAFEQIQSLTEISLNWRTIKTGRSITDIEITYLLEKDDLFKTKPTRPRLAKRPHVKSGSHDEGEWMKKNTEILYQYEKDLKKYDPTLRLTMPDLRRAVECSKYCKRNWHEEKKRELAMREGKNTKISVAKTEQNKDISFSKKDLELIQNF